MPGRKITFSIFRHNPYDPDSSPRMQDYVLEETPRMNLFTVLNRIREEMDPSLRFDFVCRAAICGSCGMLVNGRPRLACNTRTEQLPRHVTLLPLPFFKLVGDLSIDTGTWFREMGERVRSWIHAREAFDPSKEEERMPNDVALLAYDLDRCIECGCCLAACATAVMRPDFLGATGLLRVARFLVDPRDQRSTSDVFEVVGTDQGIYGCVGLMGCDDYCPKDLPLAAQLAYLRRRLSVAGLRSRANAGPDELKPVGSRL
ncbi:MAG: fumarate reductase iron-sulfur subunit [Dehalococcoidia bacterium]